MELIIVGTIYLIRHMYQLRDYNLKTETGSIFAFGILIYGPNHK